MYTLFVNCTLFLSNIWRLLHENWSHVSLSTEKMDPLKRKTKECPTCKNSYLVLPGWGHILTLVTQTHQDRFIPAHVFAAIHVHFNPSKDLFPTMRNAMFMKAWGTCVHIAEKLICQSKCWTRIWLQTMVVRSLPVEFASQHTLIRAPFLHTYRKIIKTRTTKCLVWQMGMEKAWSHPFARQGSL